jgi:hypothetical protein
MHTHRYMAPDMVWSSSLHWPILYTGYSANYINIHLLGRVGGGKKKLKIYVHQYPVISSEINSIPVASMNKTIEFIASWLEPTTVLYKQSA